GGVKAVRRHRRRPAQPAPHRTRAEGQPRQPRQRNDPPGEEEEPADVCGYGKPEGDRGYGSVGVWECGSGPNVRTPPPAPRVPAPYPHTPIPVRTEPRTLNPDRYRGQGTESGGRSGGGEEE